MWALRAALAAMALFVATAAQAKESWSFSPPRKDEPTATLTLGEPEGEESTAIFSCKAQSGRIVIFIGETDARLKPGRKIAATLSAETARLQIEGKLLANELAGVPSFEGEAAAADPFWEKVTGDLVATVGASRVQLGRSKFADQLAKLRKACARP